MHDGFADFPIRPNGLPATCCPMIFYFSSWLIRYRVGERFLWTLFITE